jgi:hypothetical protein
MCFLNYNLFNFCAINRYLKELLKEKFKINFQLEVGTRVETPESRSRVDTLDPGVRFINRNRNVS